VNGAIRRHNDLAQNRIASWHCVPTAGAALLCQWLTFVVSLTRVSVNHVVVLGSRVGIVGGMRLSCDACRSDVAMSITLVSSGLGSLVGLKESLCAGVLRVRWSFETVNDNRVAILSSLLQHRSDGHLNWYSW